MTSWKEFVVAVDHWREFIVAVCSFIVGILSTVAKMRMHRPYFMRRLRLWHVRRRLERTAERQDPGEIRELNFLLQVLKLYSHNDIDQGTALAHLMQCGDDRAFDVLANRLGSAPILSGEMRVMLIAAMRKLLS